MKTTLIQLKPADASVAVHLRGVVMLLTLVMMVALSALVYTVTHRTMAQRYRARYFIDYAKARYGCESGIKQALAYIPSGAFELELVARPNEPDFSDLFYRTNEEIEELADYYLEYFPDSDWALQFSSNIDAEAMATLPTSVGFGADDLMIGGDSILEKISGPYGPPWPLVMEPYELTFLDEDMKVTVEIQDENAKFPMAWLVMDEEDDNGDNVADILGVSFETFGEWMGLDRFEQQDALDQMKSIAEIKAYQSDFTEQKKQEQKAARTTTRGRSRNRATQTQQQQQPVDYELRRDRDYANLFNSNMLDLNVLTRPTYESEYRSESALKYMGRWGHVKVNINSAPQQVLEAALVFGGDAVPVAEEIIRQRQEEPFASMNDLKERLSQYADHLKKCENFITTESDHFTVRVTAYSGVAQVSAIAAISYTGSTSGEDDDSDSNTKKMKVLAIISE